MSQLVRKKFHSYLKHARIYLQKVVSYSLTNLWQMVVTQQIAVTLTILIITTVVYISKEVITADLSIKNLQAVFIIIGATVFMVIVISLLRSPFQIDRERIEEIGEKSGEIDSLQLKITELEKNVSRTTLTPQRQASSLLPLAEQGKSSPIIECQFPRFSRIGLDEVYFEDGRGIGDSLIIDFYLKPIANPYSTITAKAKVEFRNLENGNKISVRDAIWLEEMGKYIDFKVGDTKSLFIGTATYRNNTHQIVIGEHHLKPHGVLGEDILTPNWLYIEGNDFQIIVSVVLEYYSEYIANPVFELSLSLSPTRSFAVKE